MVQRYGQAKYCERKQSTAALTIQLN